MNTKLFKKINLSPLIISAIVVSAAIVFGALTLSTSPSPVHAQNQLFCADGDTNCSCTGGGEYYIGPGGGYCDGTFYSDGCGTSAGPDAWCYTSSGWCVEDASCSDNPPDNGGGATCPATANCNTASCGAANSCGTGVCGSTSDAGCPCVDNPATPYNDCIQNTCADGSFAPNNDPSQCTCPPVSGGFSRTETCQEAGYPAGYTGEVDQSRTQAPYSDCTVSGWTTDPGGDTCTISSCTPLPTTPQTTTGTCPSGQQGAIDYQRDLLTDDPPSCTPVWGDWYQTSNSCVDNTMSGTLTPSVGSCSIAAGESTCTINYFWTVTNPEIIGGSAVTTVNGTVGSGDQNSSPSGKPVAIPFTGGGVSFLDDNNTLFSTIAFAAGDTPFNLYLYNNGVLLDTASATADCAAGTTWNGGVCQDNATFMSGTLSASPNPCTIAIGDSTCNTNLTWNVSNPEVPNGSKITKPTNFTVATGDSHSNIPETVSYPSTTFYLYNNSQQLATTAVSANCITGSSWNGTVCVTSGGTGTPSGTLTSAPSCFITVGNTSCPITFSWTTQNPVTTSFVSEVVYGTPTGGNPNGNSGSSAFQVQYNSSNPAAGQIFNLINNGQQIAQDAVISTCGSGTHWDGTTCAAGGGSLSAVCTASPTSVVVNQQVTWTAVATGGSGNYAYNWYGDSITIPPLGPGGPSGPNGSQYTISYPTSGQKSLFASVTDVNNPGDTGVSCTNASFSPPVEKVYAKLPGFIEH